MDGLVNRYKSILIIGFLIVIISFFVGFLRLYNQTFLDSSVNEEVLKAYTEIVPLFGLGVLKLGIGFAIVTIVSNLRATGESAGKSLAKINKKLPQMDLPVFSRLFPKLLVLGILIEMVAVLFAVGWMLAGAGVIDVGLLHTFEVLAEPLEGVGVSLLIGGIALGLATIVIILRRQAISLPIKLTEIATGKESKSDTFRDTYPKRILFLTYLGMFITATGFVPIAFFRLSIDVWHPLWENWMFIGIGIMLFSISFWLLTIIKWLRAQRGNLGKAVAQSTGMKVPTLESSLSITKFVPVLASIGLLWMISFFVLALIGDAGLIGVYGPLVRPGKAIGMAIIFLGIGAALLAIVVNLKLTAFMLPKALSKIVGVIKGEKMESSGEVSRTNPMSLAPKKLYFGIILGAIVALLGTFPLAWIRVTVGPNDPLFLIVERIIGTTVGLGVGLIFFFIGMFFTAIVTFVKGRRTMISEGITTSVYYTLEKKEKGKNSS